MDDHHHKEPMGEGEKEAEKHHGHHILSNSMGMKILSTLLILTFLTVVASRINFGWMNFPIAMFIASAKALLVVLFFMGMKYDNNENRIIFASSFIFAAIFLVLTGADIFTRGDFKVHGPIIQTASASSSGFKFKKFWEPRPEIAAHGKEIFNQNCVVCHGEKGEGNGPAAAGLNPHPRNFTQDAGWKNGRQPSKIFSTITTGLPPMPSFSNLPIEDRWSLVAYVLSFGPPDYKRDTPEDLKKVGITDPNKDDGGMSVGGKVKRTIPIDFAMDRYISQKGR